ncbi:TPA: hypothetical protein DEF17_08100 [bacterium]|nr:hypothetical protein [bacterium]
MRGVFFFRGRNSGNKEPNMTGT